MKTNFQTLFNKTLELERREVRTHNVWLTFLNARRMRELNAKIRGIDAPTDVLAIPLDMPPAGGEVTELGDIIICRRMARKKRIPVAYLYVHGLLHLLGYGHETDADYEIMHAKTEVILE